MQTTSSPSDAGCLLRRRDVGDTLWRTDGVLPTMGPFTLWLVCELYDNVGTLDMRRRHALRRYIVLRAAV